MQKALPYPRVIHSLWQRIANVSKTNLLFGLVLLLLTSLANPAKATDFYKEFVAIDNGSGNNNYYYVNNPVNQNPFQGANLGSYDINTGKLFLSGEANTFSDNGDEVQPPQMFYRVYQQGTTPNGGFSPLNLSLLRSGDDGKATNQTWSNTTTRPNLLSGIGTAGTYVLEVYYYFTATYSNSGGSGSFTRYDSNNGNNYKATFTVSGSIPAQWTGTNSNSPNNWFDASNWSTGQVPNSTTDVVIPFVPTGTTNPQISSGTAYVHKLVINGNPNGPGLSMFQTGGELQIFGDFVDNNGSFYQTGGAFTLAGNATQSFSGESLFDMRVQGGSTKTLSGSLSILNTLSFVNGGGKLVTSAINTPASGVTLNSAASLSGESESNYVLGIVHIERTISQGNTDYFGNIGIELTTTTGTPGKVVVTRTTGGNSGFFYSGVGTSQSIRRGFIFQPDNPDNLTFNLVFHYLDTELNSISENNLRLFRSVSGTNPFQGLGATSADITANTLTRTGIPGTLAATFTLGDATNPLPVTLVSFAATATTQGAALHWITASELDSKGFGIERQLAGSTTWQSVGYVAASNLASGSSYDYLDKTLPASATQVYYRLREEDKDGTLSYSPVAAISRAAAGADLTLSPVPLQAGPLTVSFAEAGQAGTEILVLNMQGQRMLHYITTASADGGVNLALDNLAAGVYLVSVQVPGQAARHARFVKN